MQANMLYVLLQSFKTGLKNLTKITMTYLNK